MSQHVNIAKPNLNRNYTSKRNFAFHDCSIFGTKILKHRADPKKFNENDLRQTQNKPTLYHRVGSIIVTKIIFLNKKMGGAFYFRLLFLFLRQIIKD